MKSQSKDTLKPCRIEFGFCQEHQSGEVVDQPMGYCEEWAIHGPRRAESPEIGPWVEAFGELFSWAHECDDYLKDHPKYRKWKALLSAPAAVKASELDRKREAVGAVKFMEAECAYYPKEWKAPMLHLLNKAKAALAAEESR